MAPFLPWTIIHVELDALPDLPSRDDCSSILIFFWWRGTPLGDLQISADSLPFSKEMLAEAAAIAIARAVGNKVFATGFEAPLAENPTFKSRNATDWEALANLSHPLAEIPLVPSTKSPGVSIVVCTRERASSLCKCLLSLQSVLSAADEIIVVDNAPKTDETRKLIDQFPEIKYCLEPEPGLSKARNAGISACTREIIAFTDDDVLIHPLWVDRVRYIFSDLDLSAMTGLVLPQELETEAQVIFEMGHGNFGLDYRSRTYTPDFLEKSKWLGPPVWRIGAGANMAFRRDVFTRVGKFDERLGAGASGCSEDSEFWYRILANGGSCRFSPEAVVFHTHRRELSTFRQQMFFYMRGHVMALVIQFFRYKHVGNLIRLFFVLPGYYMLAIIYHGILGATEMRKSRQTEMFGAIAGLFYTVRHFADTAYSHD